MGLDEVLKRHFYGLVPFSVSPKRFRSWFCGKLAQERRRVLAASPHWGSGHLGQVRAGMTG
jgi:hypothetical protein